MIVINLLGGPGLGKSTTAAGVFSLLKLHGVNAEYVPEFAKDLTWEERYKTLDNQYYVWAKQYHRIWRLRDEVDVIITDSPLLLSLVYGTVSDNFTQTVIETFNEFNNMNYVLQRTKKYWNRGRNQTAAEARVIDKSVMDMLERYSITHKIVRGNYKAIDDVTFDVLETLDVGWRYVIQDRWND